MRNRIIVTILGAFSLFSLHAQDIVSVPFFLKVDSMAEASAPSLYSDRILFTYQSAKPIRNVGVAFAHEGYRRVHTMQRNPNAIFFLLYSLDTIPENAEAVEYRYVIDGIWYADPNNENVRIESNGVKISTFALEGRESYIRFPKIAEDGAVEFVLKRGTGEIIDFFSVDGSRVFIDDERPLTIALAGSFNGWDPFTVLLNPSGSSAGTPMPLQEYRLTMQLPPGEYFYYYVINGTRILDPHNPMQRARRDGRRVSYLFIPPY